MYVFIEKRASVKQEMECCGVFSFFSSVRCSLLRDCADFSFRVSSAEFLSMAIDGGWGDGLKGASMMARYGESVSAVVKVSGGQTSSLLLASSSYV